MECLHEFVIVPKEVPANIVAHPPVEHRLVPMHWHRGLEIIYSIDAWVNICVNGAGYHLKEQEFIIINSCEPHSPYADPRRRGRALSITFSYNYMQSIYSKIDEVFFDNKLVGQLKKPTEELKACLQELSEVYHNDNKEEFFYLKSNEILNRLLYILFCEFKQTKKVKTVAATVKYQDRFLTIMNYMEAHYREAISTECVADYYGISREHLCRNFRKYVGTTFKDYLNSVRMNHAIYEMAESDDTILNIGLNNGFTDERGFISAFRKIYDVTPSTYKRLYLCKTTENKQRND